MRNALLIIPTLVLTLAGCGGDEPAAQHSEGDHAAHGGERASGEPAEGEAHAEASGPAPTRVLEDGARLYGAELAADTATTALADIASAPDRFNGQVVRTEGEIARVCQTMGCWMELRAEGTEPIRVPMAGHAFFLPRDAAGRPATVEGRVVMQELSPEARAHLESEGAVATTATLSIEASSVVVR